MTALRSSLRSSSIALSLTAVLGCQIDMSLGDLDDTSTSSGEDDGPASSATSAATSAADGTDVDMAESTGAEGGATSDVDGTTSLDSGDTEAVVCLPEPEALTLGVDLDPDAFPESGELVVEADCVVQGVVEDGDLRTYALECDEDGVAVPHVLEARRSSGPIDLPLAAGTSIHLQAYREYPIDGPIGRYIAVRDMAGELVLGAYDGGHVPDRLGIDVDAWFAPLEYALAFGDCEPEPYEDPGTTFIVDPCPAAQTRLAVSFQWGDEAVQLLDRTSGQLGPLSLFVTHARHLDPVDPENWCGIALDAFSFVAYREK